MANLRCDTSPPNKSLCSALILALFQLFLAQARTPQKAFRSSNSSSSSSSSISSNNDKEKKVALVGGGAVVGVVVVAVAELVVMINNSSSSSSSSRSSSSSTTTTTASPRYTKLAENFCLAFSGPGVAWVDLGIP